MLIVLRAAGDSALPKYSLTRAATSDLIDIFDYTQDQWGTDQAEKYRQGLTGCCVLLAEMPSSGRLCENIRPGLHRQEQGKHVVFYRKKPDGTIRISRILHQSRLPDLERFPR